MKISMTEFKKRFPIGTKYVGEFIGANRSLCKPGAEVSYRVIQKITPTVITSLITSGPYANNEIDMLTKGVTIDERGNSYYLSLNDSEFLRVAPSVLQ